jgi:tetratricopeptide (TPR) repeat protein
MDRVRGIDPGQVVFATVIRAFDAALADLFFRQGRIWTCRQVGRRISMNLLSAAGARAPCTDAVSFGLLSSDVDRVRIELDTRLGDNAHAPSVVRALEFAGLVAAADDALVQGQLGQAREAYMQALEQAPRHRELVLAVAEMDVLAGGREHAALGLLSETLPAVAAGRIGAELLELTGDRQGALEALDTAIRNERYSPLRALLYLQKAKIESQTGSVSKSLDEAVAAAPTMATVRWVRFEARAKRGDVEGALADAQFLETCTGGSRAKFGVCLRCGQSLYDAGLCQQAAHFFERALRYRPDDCKAAVGLARSFVNVGQSLRAIALLERATASTGSIEPSDPHAQLLLACLIAKEIADLPQAVARVRQISAGSDVAVEARHWEARWRHQLGDIVGASVAWSRMRELVELGQRPSGATEWFLEAAIFERETRHDLPATERHLAAALLLAPHDNRLNALYRDAAASLAALALQLFPPRTRQQGEQ